MKISPAEMQVMERLWADSPRSAEDLAQALGPVNDWSEATVRTLIGRLVKKGAVEAQAEGRRYAYRPALSRADYEALESESLVDRLFAGELTPLVAQFTRRRRLTAEDLTALRALIAELGDDHDRR